jgi:hypothetical protein
MDGGYFVFESKRVYGNYDDEYSLVWVGTWVQHGKAFN